jgi:DNA-binding transcriptional LysR family regulator
VLGFIESPADIGGLAAADVGSDELVCVVGGQHPWARRRGPIPAVTLVATPLVMRERGSGTRDLFVAACVAAGLGPPAIAMELGSTEAVKAAVLNGAGPAVLSRLAVTGSRGLHLVPVAGLDLTRRLRAVWLPNHPLDRRAKALLAVASGRSEP